MCLAYGPLECVLFMTRKPTTALTTAPKLTKLSGTHHPPDFRFVSGMTCDLCWAFYG